jgi:paraquat-inducible protein A
MVQFAEGLPPAGKAMENRLLMIALGLAALLLTVGLVSPLLTLKTFFVLRNSFSVLSGICDLWLGGRYFLSVLLLLFSVVLPVGKLLFLATCIVNCRRGQPVNRRILDWIHDFGRWGMLDVLAAAVLIVTVKLGAIASVEVHWGLYCFATSVLLIMLITHRIAVRDRAAEI